MGEISEVKCSKEDEVMEEEIIYDRDKEWGDGTGERVEQDSNYVA